MTFRLPKSPDEHSLARHILPNAGTLLGVCTTLIGLVKILEVRIGPSRVDEYAALAALLFLTSAITSYISIRHGAHPALSRRCEAIADLCFMIGLVAITVIATFFAYEII
jgi:hypothetical protein